MKIGLQIPDFSTPRGPERLGAELARVARTADDAWPRARPASRWSRW
jgi:hypothetical protein